MEIKEISEKEAAKIIAQRKPLGLFLVKENDMFVAIDNTKGEAWTEEFRTKLRAIAYLDGASPPCGIESN